VCGCVRERKRLSARAIFFFLFVRRSYSQLCPFLSLFGQHPLLSEFNNFVFDTRSFNNDVLSPVLSFRWDTITRRCICLHSHDLALLNQKLKVLRYRSLIVKHVPFQQSFVDFAKTHCITFSARAGKKQCGTKCKPAVKIRGKRFCGANKFKLNTVCSTVQLWR